MSKIVTIPIITLRKIHKFILIFLNCYRSLNQSKKIFLFYIFVHHWEIMIVEFFAKHCPSKHNMFVILALHNLAPMISSIIK